MSHSDNLTTLESACLSHLPNRLKFEASLENLQSVLNFIKQDRDFQKLDEKSKFNMIVAVEEIFSNIALYAYDNKGDVEIKTELEDDFYFISFEDSGKKYNPLKKQDPDITVSLDKRDVGGLGIMLAKKMTDTAEYHYENGKNLFKIGIKIKK